MSLSAAGVAFLAAVFPIFVSIAFKLLSAVFADKTVVRFPPDVFRVTVPPCVPASVGTKQLDLFANRLNDRLSAVPADALNHILGRMPADIGANGIYRHSQRQSNFRRRFSPGAHDI